MQSLQVTLFGQNDPKVHDCQCCHERDDKKRTAEANAETDHNASHADVHGIATEAIRTGLNDGSGRRDGSHRRAGFLEDAATRTDENDGQDSNEATDERARLGERKAADQKY